MAGGRPTHVVPSEKRIDVWSNGEYVYATAGDGPDEYEVCVSTPVRGGEATRRDEFAARQGVVACLKKLRALENGKYYRTGRLRKGEAKSVSAGSGAG